MYKYVHECKHLHVYLSAHLSLSIYLSISPCKLPINPSVYLTIYPPIAVYIIYLSMSLFVCENIYIYIGICTKIDVYMYKCIHIYIYVYIYVYIYIYVYTYLDICMPVHCAEGKCASQ